MLPLPKPRRPPVPCCKKFSTPRFFSVPNVQISILAACRNENELANLSASLLRLQEEFGSAGLLTLFQKAKNDFLARVYLKGLGLAKPAPAGTREFALPPDLLTACPVATRPAFAAALREMLAEYGAKGVLGLYAHLYSDPARLSYVRAML